MLPSRCVASLVCCAFVNLVVQGSTSTDSERRIDESLQTCEACVASEKSWQEGACEDDCILADVGCFQDEAGCKVWNQQVQAKRACEAAKSSCEECLQADESCMWERDTNLCFMGANYFGPEEAVVTQGQTCSGAETTSVEMDTCESCVARGKSWQLGQCDEYCMVADAGCYQDVAACESGNSEARASKTCAQVKSSCEECLIADDLCIWDLETGICFMGAHYFGPSEHVAGHGYNSCSERMPDTCKSCVAIGKSWQQGHCYEDCMIADTGCHRDVASCERWELQNLASETCAGVKSSCEDCLRANELCIWELGTGHCFMGANYFGPPQYVATQEKNNCNDETQSESIPKTCESCVASGKSWQEGSCSQGCMIADAGCYQDASSCRRWHKEVSASKACQKAQSSCETCLQTDDLCVWELDSGLCFMGARYFGPSDAIASNTGSQSCKSIGDELQTPPDVQESTEDVYFSLRVSGIDYATLVAKTNKELREALESVIKLETSRAAGENIRPEHVETSFSAGSLIADVFIHIPSSTSSDTVLGSLSGRDDMVERIASSFREVRGIASISTGYIVATLQKSPRLRKPSDSKGDSTDEEEGNFFNVGAIVGGIAIALSIIGLFCLFVKYQNRVQKRDLANEPDVIGVKDLENSKDLNNNALRAVAATTSEASDARLL